MLYAIIAALSLAVIVLFILLSLPEGEQSTENGTAEENDSTAQVPSKTADVEEYDSPTAPPAADPSTLEGQPSESNGTQEGGNSGELHLLEKNSDKPETSGEENKEGTKELQNKKTEEKVKNNTKPDELNKI